MATDTIVPLFQPVKKPLSGAERQAAYRARKKAKANLPAVIPAPEPIILQPIPPAPSRPTHRISIAPLALRVSALALAAVGLSMNAVYARSLGSSDLSGWLFLALGLAADCAALSLPTVAASAWKLGEKSTALAAW